MILIYLLLLLLLFLSVIVSVSFGTTTISLSDVYQVLISGGQTNAVPMNIQSIIWQIRLPRVLLALAAGFGLSLTGAVMQASVRNPLADPFILGISSGASLGATVAIFIGFGTVTFLSLSGLTLFAFVGAILSSFVVLTISEIGNATTTKLLLTGMIVQAIATAFSNFIIYFAGDNNGMQAILFWTMGSLSSANFRQLPLLYTVILSAAIFFFTQTRNLNIMLLGDSASLTLGVNLPKLRRIYLVIAALLTAVITANTGVIGFVGLIVPHMTRGLKGSSHETLLPLSTLIGALFLVWADLISRIIIFNAELPIGIVTAMIGAPMLLSIVLKKDYRFG